MSPFVTILICNHNYGHWIKDAINSALNQDYPEDRFSLCIVDDASTDNSVEIIKELLDFKEEKYKYGDNLIYQNRHTLISLSKNGGPSRARNFGIERVLHKTDYYLILDADDTIYPNKISRMIEAINKREHIGVVYADYINWDIETGRKVPEYKESFNGSRLVNECIVHSGSLVKRDALMSVAEQGKFFCEDLRVCEDYDLWLRISTKWLIIHVPEILGVSRVTPVNSTNSVKNEIWQSCWQKVRERFHVTLQTAR